MDYNCNECGTAPQDDVVVGTLGDEVLFICNRCRAETLVEETTLSEELAQVAAIKQLTDYSDEQIANVLDIDCSTVDDRHTYIKSEITAAAETLDRLNAVIGLDNVGPAESKHFHETVEEFRSTLTELPDFYLIGHD